MNPSPALLELKSVSKTFQLESGSDLKVLEDINLSIKRGEIVAILGPSGSGKSTCLRIMAGLTEATTGSALARGQAFSGMNLDISMVFQSFALLPWQTIFANIALALKPLQLKESELRARVKRAIDLVGLEGFEEAYPRELSGGMKQRVGIARAIVMERPVLFLDEPFSALDVLTADTLRTEIVSLFRERKIQTESVVLVTHNIQEAVYMATRILVMGTHPGRVRREFINDLPYPRDDSTPQFRTMVADIHRVITETLMPDTPTPAVATSAGAAVPAAALPLERLPDVQMSEMIGLVEALFDRGGQADLFDLAQTGRHDFGSTLYLVKAAELLDLVDTPKQTVILTSDGRRFAEGDINLRKKMLHDVFGRLQIVTRISQLLRDQHELRVTSDVIIERFSEWFPNEIPEKMFQTLVSWGRFAEFFGYNDNTKEIYLDLGQEPV